MVDRISKKAMSYKEWENLGPLFHKEDQSDYDGTRREAPTTPNWTKMNVGGPNRVAGNPDHSSNRDGFTNAQSQWTRYVEVLHHGDSEALKLVRDSAKDYDKIAGISESRHGDPDAWVAVSSDEETAQVCRDFITMCGEFYPRSKGVMRQELPTKAEDLPTKEMIDRLVTLRPKRNRRRILDNGKITFKEPGKKEAAQDAYFATRAAETTPRTKQAPRHYSGMIAIFCDNGMEDLAEEYVRTKIDKRLLVAPENQGALLKALAAKKPKGVVYPKAYSAGAKQAKAGDELLSRVDGVICFRSHAGSRLDPIIAEAARQGKLARIIDPDGLEQNVIEEGRLAKAGNMSKKEYAQSKTAYVFDMTAKDPWANFGLGMVRDAKKGSLTLADISKIYGYTVTESGAKRAPSINEIIDIATSNPQSLITNKDPDSPQLSSSAVSLLADKKVIAAAQQSLQHVRRETKGAGWKIIGPEDYPESLKASPDQPPYLFIRGDEDFFKTADMIVGVTGAQARKDTDQRRIASPTTQAVAALASQPATMAYVQGQTAIDMPESGRQILIATAGTEHTTKEDLEKEDRIVENGGVVIRTTPPINRAYFFDPTAWNKETNKKGALVAVPSTTDKSVQRNAAKLLGAMSQSLLLTDINAKETESHQHVAMLAALKTGRLPVTLNYSEYEGMDHTSGNRALVAHYGQKAMVRAGFGARDVEALSADLRDQYLAINARKNPAKAMENLVRHMRNEKLDLPEDAASKDRELAEQAL